MHQTTRRTEIISTPSVCQCVVCFAVDFFCCEDLTASFMRWISFQWCNQEGSRVQTYKDNWKESTDIFFFHTCSFCCSIKVSCEVKSPCVAVLTCAYMCNRPVCKTQRVWCWSNSGREVRESLSRSPFIPFFFLISFTTNKTDRVFTKLVMHRNGSRVFTIIGLSHLTSTMLSEIHVFFLEKHQPGKHKSFTSRKHNTMLIRRLRRLRRLVIPPLCSTIIELKWGKQRCD